MLEVVSAPAASVFAVAPVADPADDSADDQRAVANSAARNSATGGIPPTSFLAEPRHDTLGGHEVEHSSEPLKSAAVCRCGEPD
ncbi:hypothetical protein E4U56_000221 [Claviceps arundinis]|uniref:Uncharacterized protein n=1 Tax=Claviceps arundinis TaxID=1623583 RepID=A0A9P7SR74_9HYPO|nr:hypothetical protein E4U56_000221 [Claviceps arundinis]